ncbi:MAG: SRPBCC family protein [Actinomycetota bacterium]|nr:SRPBCC family protein [Actinomycetota bacterium]
MRTWTTETTVAGLPDEVLALLTDPNAIARWTPVPFELLDMHRDRLVAGTRARVLGRLAGRTLEFDVTVLAADEERLALVADGPISIDVEYRFRPVARGSELRASVSVRGSGLIGRVLAQATDALLAAGALSTAIGRIGRELEPAIAA